MKREMRRCRHCGCFFEVCPKVKKHEYCKKKRCQKARKAAAQKRRMAEDPQYREDQYTAQKDWRANHPDYWKQYRAQNQDYTKKNREMQHERNRRREVAQPVTPQNGEIAKMDALSAENDLFSGRYKMLPLSPAKIATMTPIIVEIDVIRGTCSV